MTSWSHMMGVMGGRGLELLVLLTLVPLTSWMVESLPVFCSGQKGGSLRLSYRRTYSFLKQTGAKGLDLKAGLCCVCLLWAFLALPGFFLPDALLQKMPVMFLSDPLLVGSCLLLARFYLMPGNVFFDLANGAFVLLWLYILLLLVAPQSYDISLLTNHVNAPANGVLTTSLLALMLAVPLPVASDLRRVPQNEKGFRQFDREEADRRYGLLVFFQAAWVLFLSDLIVLPFNSGGWSAFSGSFIWRVLLVIVGCTVCRLTKIERNLHSIALFLGLGLLFALSGRLGS